MILSAGLGSRMEKAGESLPKPLVKVLGKPLIYYPLQLLKEAGFKEVVINLYHRTEEIRSFLGEEFMGIKIHFLIEPRLLGTGGGIKNAQKFFPAQRWLTLNADTIIELNLKELISYHQKHNPLATMVVSPSRTNSFTPIYLNKKNQVLAIGKKPKTSRHTIKTAYCGVQILEGKFLKYLPEAPGSLIEQGYLPALGSQEKILGYLFTGFWIPVDDLKAKLQAETELKNRTGE